MKKLLRDISKLKVAVVGDVILDHYVWGDADRLSPEAPVVVVDVKHDTWFAGGAANVAIDAAHLKANVSLFGSTGADEANAIISNMLLDEDVDFRRSRAAEGAQTIVKTRVVVKGQQLIRIDRNGNPQLYRPSLNFLKKMLESVKKADCLIVSDYARGFLDDNILYSLIETARSQKKFVAVDYKPRRKLHFSNPSLLSANRSEAFMLAEMYDDNPESLPIDALAESIYRRYAPEYLVVTLGKDGMYICKKSKPIKHIPTIDREVCDTSGAGDAVTTALSLAMCAGADFEKAAKFANIAAGVVVGKMGSSTISASELKDFKL